MKKSRATRAAENLNEIFGGAEGMREIIQLLVEKGSDPNDMSWHSIDAGDARYAIGRPFPKSRLKAYNMNAAGKTNLRSSMPMGAFLMHCFFSRMVSGERRGILMAGAKNAQLDKGE